MVLKANSSRLLSTFIKFKKLVLSSLGILIRRAALCVLLISVSLVIVIASAPTSFAQHSTPRNYYEHILAMPSTCDKSQRSYWQKDTLLQSVSSIWATDGTTDGYGNPSGVYSSNEERTLSSRNPDRMNIWFYGTDYGCPDLGSDRRRISSYHIRIWYRNPKTDAMHIIVSDHNYVSSDWFTRGNFSDVSNRLGGPKELSFDDLGLNYGETRYIVINIESCGEKNQRPGVGGIKDTYTCGRDLINVRIHRPVPPWQTSGDSRINTTKASPDSSTWKPGTAFYNVRPGAVLYWRHSLRTNHGQKLYGSINIDTYRDNFYRNGYNKVNLVGNRSINELKWFDYYECGKRGTYCDIRPSSGYFVTQRDVGSRVCEHITWQPWSSADKSSRSSTPACADVPYHYPAGVSATESVDRSTVTPGETINFTNRVSLRKGPTKTKSIKYSVYRFILKRGNSLPIDAGKAVSSSSYNGNCYYGRSGSENHYSDYSKCENVKTGTIKEIDVGSSWSLRDSVMVDNQWLGNPGDQICQYVAVDNAWQVDSDNNSNHHLASNIACSRIGKRPQLHIEGADSYAQKGFIGQLNLDRNRDMRGSYGQYSLLTNSGSVENFGSNRFTSLSRGDHYKKLIFANSSSSLGYGGLGVKLNDPGAAKCREALASYGIRALVGNQAYCRTLRNSYSDSRLTAEVPDGVRLVLYVDGDITVTGSNSDAIRGSLYREYPSITQMPSLVIQAKGNIKIDSGTELISGVSLVAGNRFYSCSDSTNISGGPISSLGTQDSSACRKKLWINGAVISKKSPILHRTWGAGNNKSSKLGYYQDAEYAGSPSEVFNYTPDIWLLPRLGGDAADQGFKTVRVTNLPVRY